MNKLGIYYAYWTRNWDADFVPYIAKVKDLGFDILEVNSGTVTRMDNVRRDQLKHAAKEAGIELTFCIGLPHEYDIASEDAAVRQRGIDFLKQQAEMLHYMGGKKLGGIIYAAWPGKLPDGVEDRRPYRDRSVACMREVIKTVEDYDLLFNVEVVNRFEQYLMNTCEEGLDYLDRVGSDHCKLLLDTFHMNIEEDSFHDAIKLAGDKLGHFHLGESNRRPPGRGRLPWTEICGALKEIDYQGDLVMEPFLIPGGEVGRDISVFRSLGLEADLDGEARSACDFMRRSLR